MTVTEAAATKTLQGDLEFLKALRAQAKTTPDDAITRLEIAKLYVRVGRPEEALEALDHHALKSTTDTALVVDACQLFIDLGAFDLALRRAARGLALGTDGERLLTLHERALRRIGEDAALGITPKGRRNYLKGMDALARGEPNVALAAFQHATSISPRLDAAWFGWRGALAVLGDDEGLETMVQHWKTLVRKADKRIAIAIGRRPAADGRLLDPRDVKARRPMREVLPPVDSLKALAAQEGFISLDPGGGAVTLDPVIPVKADGSDRVVLRHKTPEVFLAALDHAALIGRGAVLTRDNVLINEMLGPNLDKYGLNGDAATATFSPDALPAGISEVKVFEAPALLLAGATDKSFGDWMLNFVPRLAIARDAGLTCPVVVNSTTPPPYLDMLRALGVRDKDIIVHNRGGVSLFRKLYVPSWPMPQHLQPMDDLFGIYRDLIVAPPADAPKRIYLSREKITRRDMTNEAEVRAAFERRGFEVVHPQLVGQSRLRELLAGAEYVGAPYGSALLNLGFAGARPTAIVCMPPPIKPGYLDQTALWLGCMGLRFGYVYGEVVGEATEHPRDTRWRVDIADLEQAIDTVLATPRP